MILLLVVAVFSKLLALLISLKHKSDSESSDSFISDDIDSSKQKKKHKKS